jgi:hypothetical protein
VLVPLKLLAQMRALFGLPAQGGFTIKPLDIVTVCFPVEINLLRLQARSLRLHFDERSINSISVIVNWPDEEEFEELFETFVEPEYGHLRDRLKLISHATLVNPRLKAHGWRRQQALKLLIARLLSADHYLILDAKNHFIRPVSSETFFTDTGRIAIYLKPPSASLLPRFVASLRYFDIQDPDLTKKTLPTTTPFVMPRRLLMNMLDMIERKEMGPFDNFFLRKNREVTEFYLWLGFLLRTFGTFEESYEPSKMIAATVFRTWPEQPERWDRVMQQTTKKSVVLLGLHRDALTRLNDMQWDQVTKVWRAAGLLDDDTSARSFMELKTASSRVA